MVSIYTQALKQAIPLMKIVLKHNFVSGLLVMAGCVMSLHYSAIIKLNSGCPMMVATGKSETGKSTAIKTAMSLTGVVTNICTVYVTVDEIPPTC